MRIAVRKIYYKPVTPSMDIIDMPDEIWREFLYAKMRRRIEIVCQLTGKESVIGYVREIAWIPLYGQSMLIESSRIKKK